MVSFWMPWVSRPKVAGDDSHIERTVTADSSSAEIAAAVSSSQRAQSRPVTATYSSAAPTAAAAQPSRRIEQESAEERDRRVQALFDRLDAARHGFLTRADIERGVTEITGQQYGGFAASELIRVADQSKDGVIDYPEFSTFVERKEQQLRRVFDEVDVSNDQALQSSELKESLLRAGYSVSDTDVSRFMRMLDTNGDGSIQFDEWRNFLIFLPREANLGNIYRHLRGVAQLNSDGEVVIQETGTVSSFHHLIAGAVAGAVSRTSTAPLDRLKIYLQTHPPSAAIAGDTHPLVHGMRELYRSGGVRNFFRGNGLNVLKIAPESGIKFLSYDRCKRLFGAGQLNADGTPLDIGMLSKLMAGGTAGVISQGAIYPLETLKTRMMASSGVANVSTGAVAPSSNVMLRTAIEMWQEAGLRAYYRGLVPSLIGVFPFAAIDLACFETLKSAHQRYAQSKLPAGQPFTPSILATLTCGMISGTVGAVAVYPLSLVRTRLQAQGTPGHPATYAGAMDVMTTTLRREGIRGFYKGLVPTLVKVVPAVGISYTVYEKTRDLFV